MKKFLVFWCLLCCGNAWAIGSASSLVSCTTSSDCSTWSKNYCGGATAVCGTVSFNGATYTNKCKCNACGQGLVTGGGECATLYLSRLCV